MSAQSEEFLAPYACRPSASRGRLHHEPESASRTCFQRDRDRVIHCSTFRRLKHKTQVFVYHVGDHYRTRLTHSIEVAQIARSVCRALRLNDDLAEALALAHDFGHTPFGHAGEDALSAAMEPYGGFDHNAQSLRLVTTLEKRYAAFDGLNLTWETLEGLAKHNGPLTGAPIDPKNPPMTLPVGVREYLTLHDLEVHTHAGAEAQVAALSDDVAYNNHDLDDGLRAGLFTLDEIADVGLVGREVAKVKSAYPDIDGNILIHEVVRRLIDVMVRDMLAETTSRLADLAPQNADDIRAAAGPVVAFSGEMASNDVQLKAFLREHMYRHKLVNDMTATGKKVVSALFALYIREPARMPERWAAAARAPETPETARVVADFVAGMTDSYAMKKQLEAFGPEATKI